MNTIDNTLSLATCPIAGLIECHGGAITPPPTAQQTAIEFVRSQSIENLLDLVYSPDPNQRDRQIAQGLAVAIQLGDVQSTRKIPNLTFVASLLNAAAGLYASDLEKAANEKDWKQEADDAIEYRTPLDVAAAIQKMWGERLEDGAIGDLAPVHPVPEIAAVIDKYEVEVYGALQHLATLRNDYRCDDEMRDQRLWTIDYYENRYSGDDASTAAVWWTSTDWDEDIGEYDFDCDEYIRQLLVICNSTLPPAEEATA